MANGRWEMPPKCEGSAAYPENNTRPGCGRNQLGVGRTVMPGVFMAKAGSFRAACGETQLPVYKVPPARTRPGGAW